MLPLALRCHPCDDIQQCGLPAAGGNAYFGQKPTHELMVRWTQLNTLMPALQFSIAPWDLSEETARLCAEAVALRKKVCVVSRHYAMPMRL